MKFDPNFEMATDLIESVSDWSDFELVTPIGDRLSLYQPKLFKNSVHDMVHPMRYFAFAAQTIAHEHSYECFCEQCEFLFEIFMEAADYD